MATAGGADRLALRALVPGTLGTVWRKRRSLVEAAVVPYLLLVLYGVVNGFASARLAADEMSKWPALWGAIEKLGVLIGVLAFGLFFAHCCRAVLDDDNQRRSHILPDGRDGRGAVYFLFVVFLASLPQLLLSLARGTSAIYALGFPVGNLLRPFGKTVPWLLGQGAGTHQYVILVAVPTVVGLVSVFLFVRLAAGISSAGGGRRNGILGDIWNSWQISKKFPWPLFVIIIVYDVLTLYFLDFYRYINVLIGSVVGVKFYYYAIGAYVYVYWIFLFLLMALVATAFCLVYTQVSGGHLGDRREEAVETTS